MNTRNKKHIFFFDFADFNDFFALGRERERERESRSDTAAIRLISGNKASRERARTGQVTN